jgi:hypothetical protein
MEESDDALFLVLFSGTDDKLTKDRRDQRVHALTPSRGIWLGLLGRPAPRRFNGPGRWGSKGPCRWVGGGVSLSGRLSPKVALAPSERMA